MSVPVLPPDAFFPAGQKWCLGAFNPYVLKERCYEPFIKILRANMNAAGALRIDHVMGLMRLYIIPDNGDAGTYVMYNFKDMLNIVAIEMLPAINVRLSARASAMFPKVFLKRLPKRIFMR